MENLDHILVFKTDVHNEDCKKKLGAILNQQAGILQWNIALDDNDRILRIVSYVLKPQEIVTLITESGHYCHELT
jgi:hypothetical protein